MGILLSSGLRTMGVSPPRRADRAPGRGGDGEGHAWRLDLTSHLVFPQCRGEAESVRGPLHPWGNLGHEGSMITRLKCLHPPAPPSPPPPHHPPPPTAPPH